MELKIEFMNWLLQVRKLQERQQMNIQPKKTQDGYWVHSAPARSYQHLVTQHMKF